MKEVFYFAIKNFIIALVVMSAMVLLSLWMIKRSDRNDEYWNTQMEICGQPGWYTETGVKQDCQPVEYIRKQMENESLS